MAARATRSTSAGEAATRAVMCNRDLVGCILKHANLDPRTFTAASSVDTTWRSACHSDTELLLAAARRPAFLTKRVFVNLFALTPTEADTFPHGLRARSSSGFMYMYQEAAISAVLPSIGGLGGWTRRIARRARSDRRQHPYSKRPYDAIAHRQYTRPVPSHYGRAC